MASTLQISYATGEDGNGTYVTGNTWVCQTFTTVGAITCDKVILELARASSGTFGTVTVSLYSTSGGVPNASLASTTMAAADITTASGGLPYTFTWATPVLLTATTEYAIVVRHSESGYVYWRQDGTSAEYGGGTSNYSSDAGGTWAHLSTTIDKLFEVWGEAAAGGGLGIPHVMHHYLQMAGDL